MPKYNPQNERLKHRYLHFLKQAKGRDEATLDGVAAALRRFEEHTRFKDFKTFRPEQAVSFKTYLAKVSNARTDKPLSKATLHQTANALKAFFQWLSAEPGYRSHITYSHADYFAISEKDARIATAKRDRPVPSLEQIHHVLQNMPHATEVEMRDRTLMAFTILTGMRDGAIASMRIGLVDLNDGSVFQDARTVRTKFSKTFKTWFFPVGGDAQRIFEEWVRFLQEKKLFGPDDPVFPATKIAQGEENHFVSAGLERKFWTNAGPIRKIVKGAFLNAELPPFNPHSFRKTLVRLMMQVCTTPEDIQAWSQNLGHEKPDTTFASYGQINDYRRREIIMRVVRPATSKETPEMERKRLLKRLTELA